MSALQLEVDPSKAIAATKKLRDGLDSVTDAAAKVEHALDDAGRASSRVQSGARVVQHSAKSMEAAFDSVGTAADRMGRSANDNIQGMQRQMAAAAGVVSKLGGALAIAATAAVGFALQARQIAREIATIGDEAKRAGVGVRAFQELRYVADQNRVSIDALTDGLKELNLRADEFVLTGKGSGAEAFQRLGLTAGDLTKKLANPSALLTEIIGKLERMDKAAQIRIADEIFGGEGGEQFVQLIDEGAAGIRRTIDEANRLGIVMDESVIAKAAEVDRAFNTIATTVESKLKTAVVSAAGALADFMEGFRSFENQRDGTLNTELGDIGKRRLENEARIAELRSGATIWNRSRSESAATVLEEENAALAEQEKHILDVLNARGAFNMSSKETEDALRKVGQGNQAVGESLDYVTRNGGAAAAVVDQYGKSITDLRGRLSEAVAGAKLTVDTFGQTEGAIAAARFEADAMADALRAANAAGKDGIDPALASFIREQASEYGRLTDKIGASTKAEAERQRVADQATARNERIAGFEADLDFERSIIGLPEAEQRIRETLHGLDVEFDTVEGRRLAANMRYNDALTETQDRLRETGDIGKEAFGGILDALTRGGDLLGNLIGAFADLGRQLASMGAQKLLDGLFGTPGKSGAAGVLGSVLGPVAANQNAPIPTSRPTGTTTAALAQTVTQNVSSNLLTSMLGAGKSRSHITGLNKEFATALNNMIDAAPAAVQASLTINSGYRSVARQAELFDAALKKYGSVSAARKWVAPPGNSMHNSGNAADLGYGSVSARQWVHQNAGKYGLAFPLSHENWHIELAGARGNAKTIEKATSSGVQDAMRTVANDRWGGMREGDVVSPAGAVGMTRGQAGFGALTGALGIAANGYAGANPIMGALSGAMGGVELGGMLGGAFPALGATAGPLGVAAGAPLGSLGTPLNRERSAA